MEPSTSGHQRGRCSTGFYAVVSYLPEPLGGFLDDLRAELVSALRLRSHLTILPPRCLAAQPDEIARDFARAAASLASFDLRLGRVELFESTRVAYLSVAEGGDEVEDLNRRLNAGALCFDDYFPFHPHLTIAQNIEVGSVARLLDLAARRWRECPHPPAFSLCNLILLRSVAPDRWETVAEHVLQPATLLRTA